MSKVKKKGNFNIIKKMGLTKLEVSSLNQTRLLNAISRENIKVFDIERKSNKNMTFYAKSSNIEKIFAISNKLCYNVKAVDEKGLKKILKKAVRNAGVLLGVIVFLIGSFLSDKFLLAIDFIGDGSVQKQVLENYLESKGVKRFASFSTLSLDDLAVDMLKDNDFLTYASLKKVGARLQVEVHLNGGVKSVVDDKVTALYSTVCGVVESIKVYRGTALVKVGDTVSENQLLVDGFVTIRDITVSSNVYATVTIRTKKTYNFNSEYDGMEENALAMAKADFSDENAEYSVIKRQEKGCFVYQVEVSYLATMVAG